MNHFDVTLIHELWLSIKEEIPEKNRSDAAREMLVTLEDHGILMYDDMTALRKLDKNFKEAVDVIYKEYEDEDEDDDDLFSDFDY